MRHFTVRQFAKACQAQYFGPEEVLEQEIHGVVIDNRQIEEGYLFAAVAGERVDGHDAAGEQLLPLRLQQGIDHAAAHTAALDLAVEDVCLSRMQDVFAVFLVEEGYIQHAALVHGPYLHQRLSAADTGGSGGLGDHGLAAGVLPLR